MGYTYSLFPSTYVLEADKAAFEEKGAKLIVSSKEMPPSPAQEPPTESANTALNIGASTESLHTEGHTLANNAASCSYRGQRPCVGREAFAEVAVESIL